MGFFEKLRAEVVDIIEWIDDSRHTLVWRFPRYQNEIKNGARLIVRPGQVAILVKDGKLADIFEPGHHKLSTKNLPVLRTLMGWRFGFESPFKVEVYFVSTREVTDLKWGTPNPITLRDPDFGPIRIRAFGNYSLQADDPRVLLEQLVGVDSSFDMDEITEMIRALIASSFAGVVSESGVSIVDLAGQYESIGAETSARTLERIDDEYGLALPQLCVVNISLPAEVEKALDARTQMNLIGNLSQYRDYQIANAIPGMVGGGMGDMAASAMSLGVGMNMANQMLNPSQMVAPMGGFSETNVPVLLPPAPPPPPPPAWHIAENGQSVGPLPLSQLAEAVATGRLRRETLVWTSGMASWSPAGDVPQLVGLFGAPPPPIPLGSEVEGE